MNNKFLLIIAVLVVAVGGFIVLGGKKSIPTPSTQSEVIATPTQTQPAKEVTTVTLTDAGFTPKDITVKVETKVVWVNKSGKAATVNSDNHPTHKLYPFLNLGEFADGSSLEVVFDKTGKYTYHNHYSSAQVGSVTVQ